MNIIDLTHTVSGDMPVYPGTEQPVLQTGCSLEVDGFLEKKITMYSHTGTHVDAPAHLLKYGSSLNDLGVSHFHGSALVFDIAGENIEVIELKALLGYKEQIREADFVLVHTGWSRYWGSEMYFSGYPVLSREAAQWLSGQGLKGIGFDTISADDAKTIDYPIHNIFLKNDIIIIENLTELQSIPNSGCSFSCFPIKFEKADGSPVRAVAYIE